MENSNVKRYRKLAGDVFCGNRASECGRKNGYLDYGTFSKAFDKVIANAIIYQTGHAGLGRWKQVNGADDPEAMQYYIVSSEGANLIRQWTDDPLWRNDELMMWVWGVTHYGTSWDCVMTEIKLYCDDVFDAE